MEEEILSQREQRRYSKQILLTGIGTAGQEKIKKAKVLVVGAGGLGCPVLQYLVAAGIGKIGIVEFDTVNETNLQRQILYGSEDLGKLKAVIARNRLSQLNSFTEIELFNIRLDSSNAVRIFKDFDIIVDATDNPETRYVISDTCAEFGKPMVHGAIYQYEAVVSVFNYAGGPDYRRFNPEKKDSVFKNPKPSEVGIMGVLPGITGTLMSNEILKIITGNGSVLSGKVLLFNISDNSFRTIDVK